MSPFHVVFVYYKHGHSSIESFDTEDELREVLLNDQPESARTLDTKTLVSMAVLDGASESESESQWRIVAVFQGLLMFSNTNPGFA